MRTKNLLLALLIGPSASAQWSTHPAAPLVVSTNAGASENLRAMSDGNGGWLVFWRDKRTDGAKFELFGQHLDASDEALWEPNGRLVHHEPSSSISTHNVVRSGSTLYFAINSTAGSFQDSLKVFSTDLEGAPNWDQPVLITYASVTISVLYVEQPMLLPTSDGVILGWYDVYFGGSSGINVTRITDMGEVLWMENGYAIPGAAHGPLNMLPDGADGAMVNWRMSNGLGAGYRCMRVDSTGANAWDANVETNAGGAGFGGVHKVASGPQASMLFTYVEQWNKVQLDTTGALLFAPSPIAVRGLESSQGQVSMVHEDGITTVIWRDSRPPASNHDVYMQRFDTAGDMLLDEDGVLVMHLNTNIPNTGLVPSLDGGVIATIDGNVVGYSAMRMHADGFAHPCGRHPGQRHGHGRMERQRAADPPEHGPHHALRLHRAFPARGVRCRRPLVAGAHGTPVRSARAGCFRLGRRCLHRGGDAAKGRIAQRFLKH